MTIIRTSALLRLSFFMVAAMASKAGAAPEHGNGAGRGRDTFLTLKIKGPRLLNPVIGELSTYTLFATASGGRGLNLRTIGYSQLTYTDPNFIDAIASAGGFPRSEFVLESCETFRPVMTPVPGTKSTAARNETSSGDNEEESADQLGGDFASGDNPTGIPSRFQFRSGISNTGIPGSVVFGTAPDQLLVRPVYLSCPITAGETVPLLNFTYLFEATPLRSRGTALINQMFASVDAVLDLDSSASGGRARVPTYTSATATRNARFKLVTPNSNN